MTASGGDHRGQANLVALGVALLLVTAALATVLTLVGGTAAWNRRAPADRHAAVALSERIVSGDGPLAVRRGVLNGSELDVLDAGRLRALGLPPDADARVSLDGEQLVRTGGAADGAVVRRLVVVERRRPLRLQPAVTGDTAVLRGRHGPTARLVIDARSGVRVTAVFVDGRPVARDSGGLGRVTVPLPPAPDPRLRFNSTAPLRNGSVTVHTAPRTRRRAVLEVAVDA